MFRIHDDIDLEGAYNASMVENVMNFIKDYEIFENELLEIEELPPKIREEIIQFSSILIENRLFTFASLIRSAVIEIEKIGARRTFPPLRRRISRY